MTLDIKSQSGFSKDDLVLAIWDACIRFWGEQGTSEFDLWLMRLYSDDEVKDYYHYRAILRCQRGYEEEVRAAQINNAERLAAMGLKVVWKGDDYTVGKGPLMSPEMMMGMAPPSGGMGGGMPPAPMMPSAGAPMPPSPAGIPMMQDQLGGMVSAPMGAPTDMGALDVMAAGKAPGTEQQPEQEEDFTQITAAMKDLLGVGKKVQTKKKTSTKLSRIFDDMFLSDSERNKKIKEEMEATEEEANPMDMAPPGGMPMTPDMGAPMGPAPVGLNPAEQQPPLPPGL